MRDIKLATKRLKELSDNLKIVKHKEFLTITFNKDFIINFDVEKDVLYINGIYNCDIDEENLIYYVQEILDDNYEFVANTKPTFWYRLNVKTKRKGYYKKHCKKLSKKKNIKIFNVRQVLYEA